VTQRSPITTGVLLAVLAAVSFGLTTPVVAWAGRDLGPFTTGALLYGGAALSALALRVLGGRSSAPLRRSDAPRLGFVALAGAAIAPTLLAWGLQRAGATVGSLLLNLEAVFTVVLAHLIYREPIGRRVALAALMMAGGGVALAADAMTSSQWTVLGALAVSGATLAWATDNTLTRPLADRDPIEVVGAKAALGASCTIIAALIAGEASPRVVSALALLACGATGYGFSLRFYLLAQRRIGAARTGSVFALAPFIGAVLAWILGDRASGPWALAAAALFLLGVYLHATEKHRHRHVHEPVEHDHPHRHDDGHHDHVHDVELVGEHAHPHRHAPVEHDHEHAPDLHHDHEHGDRSARS
jgi:drug/metabolite transporter (DMT)-like permease